MTLIFTGNFLYHKLTMFKRDNYYFLIFDFAHIRTLTIAITNHLKTVDLTIPSFETNPFLLTNIYKQLLFE